MRKMARMISCFCFAISQIALGQTPDRLPGKLDGSWTFTSSAGVFTNKVSLTFDGSGEPGPVSGRLTFHGGTCGAQDEPFKGTWNGRELRLETRHHANVNTTRVNGNCPADVPTIYVLRRDSADNSFRGEITREGTPGASQVTVSP